MKLWIAAGVSVVLAVVCFLVALQGPAESASPPPRPAEQPVTTVRVDEAPPPPPAAAEAPAPPRPEKPNPTLVRKRAKCLRAAAKLLDKARQCGLDVGPRNAELVCYPLESSDTSNDQGLKAVSFYLAEDCATIAVAMRAGRF